MGKFCSVLVTLAFIVTVEVVYGSDKLKSGTYSARQQEFRQRSGYTASWAVQIPGGKTTADRIADRYGFRNLGNVRRC